MRYLVRCDHCDRAFWRDARDAPIPAHNRWERRATAHRDRQARCDGSGREGVWVAEGEGPLTGWSCDG